MYEKQMELFEDGGLRDEGGMVDEVSGNDVPVGSTRKEVRDDIPAMLSEGEFVFPADVVRYIGLENLMRMRQDAKQGLKQMDAMGQMGNGDEATMPDDLPFGMMDLVIVEGKEEPEVEKKAQGGVVHMNEGGLTNPPFVVPKFNPRNQDVRQYENADGKKLNIPFLGGNPVYPIPKGYFPVGSEVEEEEKDETEEAIPTDDDSDPPPPAPEGYDWKTDTSATDGEALQEWIDKAKKTSTVGNVVVGVIGAMNPLMGGLIAIGLKKEKKTIAEMLDEKIAQAQKTPIAGQVKALRELKTRLTTDEGKGILSKVVSGIIEPIADALGFGEEEKTKAKTVSSTVAGQDPDESDDATKEAVATSLRPTARPDGLLTTEEQKARIDEVEKGAAEAATTMAADDAAMQQMLAAKDEDTVMGQPVVSDLQLPDVGLDRFESPDAQETRAALGFSDPTVALSKLDPEKTTFESFTSADAEELKDKLTTDNAPATVTPATVTRSTVTNAKDEFRQSIADYLRGQDNFNADDMQEAARNYLNKNIDIVDTIAKGSGTPATTPTTTAPVQGGGDDDDNGVFAAPTSNVGNLQGMSTAEKTAAVAAVTDNLSPTERTGGAELDSALGISGLNRGGFAKRKKK